MVSGEIRELPKNREAEQVVLGSMILEADFVVPDVEEIVGVDDFYFSPHRSIFDTACKMFDTGDTVDIISLSNKLEEAGLLEKAGGRLYLNELIDKVTTTSSVKHYCEIIKKKSSLRSLIMAGAKVEEIGYSTDGDIEEAKDEALSVVMQAIEANDSGQIKQISELVDPFVERIRLMEETGDIGLSCGYPSLDNYAWGFDGKLTVIAGASSMGKSVLMMNMARKIAKKGVAAGFVSMEMSDDAVIMRLAQAESMMTRNEVLRGGVEGARRAASRIATLPLYIMSMGPSSLTSALRQMRQMVMKYHVKAIFVDYLQLIDHAPLSRNKNEEVGYIARMLKKFSFEYDVGVFTGSQLNRKAYEDDAKPELWMLRDSGNIENHSDIVLGVWRSDYSDHDMIGGEMEVIFLKLREGAQYSKETLLFYPHQQRIEENLIEVPPV